MSLKDGRDYMYLIWKSDKSRKQHIVGQLTKNGKYEFKYSKEVNKAIEDGFTPLVCFPNLNETYFSEILFPVFSSRLPDRKRKDIKDILKKYDLEEFDSYELLKRSGARLPIDNFEFIDPIFDDEKEPERIFYVAGVRYYIGCEGKKCDESLLLNRGDELKLECEPDNLKDSFAIKVFDTNDIHVGYIPRYYSKGITEAMQKHMKIQANIYNVDKSKNCNECVRMILKIKSE